MGNRKKYLAEALGTAVLVFVACGVAVASGGDLVAISLAFGLVIVAMAYSIGPVSGCHINPAVSFGAAIAKRMSWKDCLMYIIFQIIGACIGGVLLYIILGATSAKGLGQNFYSQGLFATNPSPYIQIVAALLLEAILSFLFVFTVLGVTTKKDMGLVAGLVIGATLTLCHLLGVKFTGTSVNPARSIGVAIFSCDALSELWVFIVAPLFGGTFAGILADYFFPNEK